MEPSAKSIAAYMLANGIMATVSAPAPDVRDDWPSIAYAISFTFQGRTESFPYRMGVGHVDWAKARPDRYFSGRFSREEQSIVWTRLSKPHAQFKDKALEASAAAKIAAMQKVAPHPADVLACVLDDSRGPHFDGATFDDWASEYGYESDSRKAEATYQECRAIGSRLVRLLGRKHCDALLALPRED